MKSSDDIEIGSSLSFIIGNGLSESVKDCGLCGSGDVFTSCGISESAQDKHISDDFTVQIVFSCLLSH